MFCLGLTNDTTSMILLPYVSFIWKIDPCFVMPGAVADGVAIAHVIAFQDLNGNGIQDENEPPLPSVMTAIGYSDEGYNENLFINTSPGIDNSAMLTDQDGQAKLFMFMPGCACYCSNGMAVMADAPSGYRATTPLIFNLTNDENEIYKFGFIKNP